MAQGVVSSLNLALMRINSIESNFSALEGVSSKINGTENTSSANFEEVLSGKIADSKVQETKDINSKIEDEAIEEAINDELIKNSSLSNSTKELLNEKLEATKLKSKIDLKAQSTNVEEIIETYANKYNIDSNFIKAIIKQESGFNVNATSKKGAMGLMQLMPQTAKSLGVVDAYNPNQNIEGGVKYLRNLLDKYENNKELALAAYNAGSGAVQRYGGIPPYKETQNYVNSIMSTYDKMIGVEL